MISILICIVLDQPIDTVCMFTIIRIASGTVALLDLLECQEVVFASINSNINGIVILINFDL